MSVLKQKTFDIVLHLQTHIKYNALNNSAVLSKKTKDIQYA